MVPLSRHLSISDPPSDEDLMPSKTLLRIRAQQRTLRCGNPVANGGLNRGIHPYWRVDGPGIVRVPARVGTTMTSPGLREGHVGIALLGRWTCIAIKGVFFSAVLWWCSRAVAGTHGA